MTPSKMIFYLLGLQVMLSKNYTFHILQIYACKSEVTYYTEYNIGRNNTLLDVLEDH